LNELIKSNEAKDKHLKNLLHKLQTSTKTNEDIHKFNETMSKFNSTQDISDIYLTQQGFRPNRTTTSLPFSIKKNDVAPLAEKIAELKESFRTIELLNERENEVKNALIQRINELKKDHVIAQKITLTI